MTCTPRKKWDKKLLEDILAKSQAQLVSSLLTINAGIRFTFTCKCGKLGEKNIRMAYEHGCYCDDCSKQIKSENISSGRASNTPLDKSFATSINIKYFKESLNPGIDPKRFTSNSGIILNLQCPICRHIFIGTPHGLSNRGCRYCTHQELCDTDDCDMCFTNSLASKHFLTLENYKQFKLLCSNSSPYNSIIKLFIDTCPIYDFLKNNISCRSIFGGSRTSVLFICQKCDHSFLSEPCRVQNLKDCPYCSPTRAKVLCPPDVYCSKCFDKSFASHPKSSCWDKSEGKNTDTSGRKISPREVFKGGSYEADFICNECEHQFKMKCNTVSSGFSCDISYGSWCGFCTGHRRCDSSTCDMCNGRKLSSHPFSEYWNIELNPKDISPSNIALGNCVDKFWFNCPAKKHPPYQKRATDINRGGGCPSCLRKTEAKIGEFLPSIPGISGYQKEWVAEWLRNPITKYCARFDFMLLPINIVIENDGLQHFIDGCWKSNVFIKTDDGESKEQRKRDIEKMIKAIEHGISGIRLFQPDILTDKHDWKAWLIKAINYIKESSIPVWIFPTHTLYQAHIKMCIDNNIHYIIL